MGGRGLQDPLDDFPVFLDDVLAARIAGVHPESAVVFMSGYTGEIITRGGVLEPGVLYLQKPFSASVLLRKVRGVLDAPRRPPEQP